MFFPIVFIQAFLGVHASKWLYRQCHILIIKWNWSSISGNFCRTPCAFISWTWDMWGACSAHVQLQRTAPACARALFSLLYSAIATLHSLCICSCWIFSQHGWKVQLTVMDTLIVRIFISSAIIIAPYFRSYTVEWQLLLVSMCLQKWAHLVRFSAGTESHISMKDSKLY